MPGQVPHQSQANQQFGYSPQVSSTSATPPPMSEGGSNPYARGPGSTYGGGYPRPAAKYPPLWRSESAVLQ